MSGNFLVVNPDDGIAVLKALSSSVRLDMLKLLGDKGPQNVNAIAAALGMPQSSISANVQQLEDAGLIRTETKRARKGNQKVCHAIYDEILVMLRKDAPKEGSQVIEVAMPLGLFTSCEVSAPCGLCSASGIIGLLDVPETFLAPERMNASLIWFTRGYVEYQFPNNVSLAGGTLEALEFSMELSSEVPGTSSNWPSDITFSINRIEVGTWTSPGDFGDLRGTYTPSWWKLKGSQYGMLKTVALRRDGTYVDGMKISPLGLKDIDFSAHRSIRLRVAVKHDARHQGGVNIFGRGFGNYDQDIVMRIFTET